MAALEIALLTTGMFVASLVVYTFAKMVLKRAENVDIEDEVDLTKDDYKRYIFINFAALKVLSIASVAAMWMVWRSIRNISEDIGFLASLKMFMEASFNGVMWAFPMAWAATLFMLFLIGILLAESSDRTQVTMDGDLKLTMFETKVGDEDGDADQPEEEVVVQTYAYHMLQNLNLMSLILMTLLPVLTAWATLPQT